MFVLTLLEYARQIMGYITVKLCEDIGIRIDVLLYIHIGFTLDFVSFFSFESLTLYVSWFLFCKNEFKDKKVSNKKIYP